MGFFDRVFQRLREIEEVPRTAAERAAERIEDKLRLDATTKRGNVPQFGPGAKGHPGGYVPITATAEGDGIRVRAADWVLQKAAEKGQPAEWGKIVREEIEREVRRRS